MPVIVAERLSMSLEQRVVLEAMSRASSVPHRQVVQARALLLAADGVATNEVARRCGTSDTSVRAWRRRFVELGVGGVGQIAAGRGRKAWLAEGTVAAVVEDTLRNRPDDGSTHWTTRLMALRHGIGKDSVARIWRDHGLRPWKVDTYKVSTDPLFEDKLVDVVGVYANPPERAVVFSFDEKTQCQALDRTQPSLPMKRGRGETRTHDYKRNGTTDLFAALNVATGEVLFDTKKRHTANDVLAFFKYIDLHVPEGLDVHVVLDNLSAHKTPAVAKWLAHPKRQRWHLHFTPTSSSWLNLVEGWFHLCHPTMPTPRDVRQCRSAHRDDRDMGRALQRRPKTVHLDQDSRRDHHQSPPRPHHTHRRQIRDALSDGYLRHFMLYLQSSTIGAASVSQRSFDFGGASVGAAPADNADLARGRLPFVPTSLVPDASADGPSLDVVRLSAVRTGAAYAYSYESPLPVWFSTTPTTFAFT